MFNYLGEKQMHDKLYMHLLKAKHQAEKDRLAVKQKLDLFRKANRNVKLTKAIGSQYKQFEKEINQLTNKQGVDVILDMVAGPYISRNLKCLSINGRLVIIAVQGGIKDEVNFANIMIKRQTITGSTLRPQPSTKKTEYVNSLFKNAWEYLDKGKIKPIIQREFLFSDASEAHKALEKGDHVGKFILKVS